MRTTLNSEVLSNAKGIAAEKLRYNHTVGESTHATASYLGDTPIASARVD
jgi:hypothetical protein